MMIKIVNRLRGDQRGISAVILAVVLVALLGAAMLSVDAGSLWSARRNVITASDAGVLNAAAYFNGGGGNPCNATDIQTADTSASNVMTQNNPETRHNPTDTPDGFEVTPVGDCSAGGYIPGKVRFDARLASHQSFSQVFGFDQSSAISSSTAAWGYVTGGNGLRPLAVCDQQNTTFPPLPVPDGLTLAQYWGPLHPHYYIWNELWFKRITLAQYDSFFGYDDNGVSTSIHYPRWSKNYFQGDEKKWNPNWGVEYIAPGPGSFPDGTNGHHTIHRIAMPDATCGASPGNRLWVDLRGSGENGTIGTPVLKDWLLNGYPGSVSLVPHDCGVGNDTPAPENCGGATGDRNSASSAMGTLTCDYRTPADQCPYKFPIIVFDHLDMNGSNAEYHQVAFLTLVIRGFGNINNNDNMEIDYEFVDQQVDGNVGAAPPTTNHVYQTAYQLCGADHDSQSDRCPF